MVVTRLMAAGASPKRSSRDVRRNEPRNRDAGTRRDRGHRDTPPAAAARTRTVAYLRVSTDKQAAAGVSLDAQRAKVVAYAELYDLELVALVAVEVNAGVSAKSLWRPALQRALAALTASGADALLVVKLDRLTRSVRDLGALVERYLAAGRWSLLSVGEQIDTRTAAGRLVLNVVASVAQWEREATGERTSAAMRHKASCGEYTGGVVPFGYRLGGDGVALVEVEEELAAVQAARELHAAGLSLRADVERLQAAGHRPRSGRRWHPRQVARLGAG